jgi:hypothetical protein
MPIILDDRPEYNLFIFTHKGEIPDSEFLEFYSRFFKGDTFDQARRLLIDLREADSKPRNPGTLHQFAIFVREHLKGSPTRPKVAVVAPKSLSFGLARMYQSYSDSVPWEYVVFKTIDVALAWLDVPEDLINTGEKT